VAEILAHIDFLDETIERLNGEIGQREHPFEATLEVLESIPGVGRRIAEIVVAEIGPDVERFPSAGQLASWAGLCPGQEESAGKRRSGKTRKGDRWLRSALVQAAHAARRTKTYLAAQFNRLAKRRGSKKAAVAVAHSIICIIHHLLTEHHPFFDLGELYFDQRRPDQLARQLTRRLERLGYRVQLEASSRAA
jgi:transposase